MSKYTIYFKHTTKHNIMQKYVHRIIKRCLRVQKYVETNLEGIFENYTN